jgi:hypothetical protein
MPIATFRPFSGSDEVDFYTAGWQGLLNISAMPQSVGDDDLTVAQNVYGSLRGGVYMRRGTTLNYNVGTSDPNALYIQSLHRFQMNVANGTPLPTPYVATLIQYWRSGSQSVLEVVNPPAGQQSGGSFVTTPPTTNPAQFVTMFDPDHLMGPGAIIPQMTFGGTGSIASGTYGCVVTFGGPTGGETFASSANSVSVTGSGVQLTISLPVASIPPGATTWNAYVTQPNGSVYTLQASAPISQTSITLSSVTSTGRTPPTVSTALAPSDVVVITTGQGGPYIFDPYYSATSLYVPPAWSVVSNARWCQVVNNILWFAGIPSQPNLVVGMQLGHPETFDGLNVFAMSGPVTGLSKVGAGATAGLVVGLTKGLVILTGSGPSTFVEQEVPSVDGPVSGRAMISVEGVCYFLGKDNVYAFDGSTIVPFGYKVLPYILNDPLFAGQYDLPMRGSRSLSWLMYYNRRIYVWYDSASTGIPNAGLVWDMDLQGWTTYTGQSFSCGCLLDASTDAGPLGALVGDASSPLVYNFDAYPSSSFGPVSDNGAPINAVVLTKYFKLGAPGTSKRLLQVWPETFSAQSSLNVLASPDYSGPVVQAQFVSTQGNVGVWDQSFWDQATFAGQNLLFYSESRFDFDIYFRAIAFGVSSLIVQAPWWLQGFSGRFAQQPRVSSQ